MIPCLSREYQNKEVYRTINPMRVHGTESCLRLIKELLIFHYVLSTVVRWSTLKENTAKVKSKLLPAAKYIIFTYNISI